MVSVFMVSADCSGFSTVNAPSFTTPVTRKGCAPLLVKVMLAVDMRLSPSYMKLPKSRVSLSITAAFSSSPVVVKERSYTYMYVLELSAHELPYPLRTYSKRTVCSPGPKSISFEMSILVEV